MRKPSGEVGSTERNCRHRYEPTDEVFFVQNAGARAAGTGLNKSAIIQKISLAQVDAVKDLTNATSQVTVSIVPSSPTVVNPNGQRHPIYPSLCPGDRSTYLARTAGLTLVCVCV